jgi:hypothetical protein
MLKIKLNWHVKIIRDSRRVSAMYCFHCCDKNKNKEMMDLAKYSNCLLEALKQKLLNMSRIKIYKRGKWLEILHLKFPHFYWYDFKKNCYFHFCGKNKNLKFLNQLWFEGSVEEFKYHEFIN